MNPHFLAAERSRALHQAVAERITRDPNVLQAARIRVRAWLGDQSVAAYYAEAWRDILDQPVETVCRLLAEDSDRMHDLRQTSPFAGALDPRTRWRIRDEVRQRLAHETR